MRGRHAPAVQLARTGGRGRASWRLITRLVRRDIARHKARAVLVMLLIALPVAMIGGLAVVWNLAGGSVDDYVEQRFGNADLTVAPLGDWDGHCHQADLSDASCDDGSKATPPADAARQRAALATVRLPGVTLQPVRTKGVTASWKGLDVDAQVTGADQLRLRTQQIALPRGATVMPGAHQIWINAEAAQRYGWAVGATVRIDGAPYRVSGLVRAASWPAVQIWVGPDHPLAGGGDLSWYGTGATPSAAQIRALNDSGLGVADRAGYRQMQEPGSGLASTVAITFAVGALAALVTATIAGAAFAIGARQQRRALALLGVTGADRRVLVRMMSGQGVLLGLCGAVAGAVLGCGLGNVLVAWRNARSLTYPQPLGVPWASAAGAIALGVVAATVAAWVPAHSVAGQDVLAGVRSAETPSQPARFPWPGLGLVVAGVATGAWAAMRYRRTHTSLRDTAGEEQLMIPLMIGIVLLFVGVVASLSWLVARISRPGSRGPLATRFALRDLARNRGRGTACVAASMAVMALFSAVLVLMATQHATDLATYRPSFPEHVAALQGADDAGEPIGDRVADQQLRAVRAEIGTAGEPVRERAVLRCSVPEEEGSDQHVGDAARSHCEEAMTIMVRTSAVAGAGAAEADEEGSYSFDDRPLMVDDGSLYRVLTGRAPDARVRAALSRGVVVFDGHFAPRGSTTVSLEQSTRADELAVTRSAVPALVVPGVPGSSVPALIGPDAAARIAGVAPSQLRLGGVRTWMRLQETPTQGQSDRINAAIARSTSLQQGFGYETGPSRTSLTLLRWGAALAAVLSLTVAVVVLALSLSDSRASRSALASVGASTAALKGTAAVQALVTVGLGSVLGALVGAAPVALGVWGAGPSMILAVPWGYLAALALGVPALMGVAVRFLVPAARPVLRRRD